ncbi:phospholipase A2 group XV-like isoform X2 [Bradysia coprophila]|uniref:phospholipase A2 group XV-like isoform X2 n=1 Tax=Bradysia coprophila TaxID=38358 RepID=UPI00187DB9A4|nr:phospholipase A2 group XV-like isoform X2 [Bradysia coprophila]
MKWNTLGLCIAFYIIAPCFCQIFKKSAKPLSPVIFVPGDGGNQMDARLNKPDVVHYICDQKTDYWFNIWLNLELLAPYEIYCWIDNILLIYDNDTRTTQNSPGVETRIPGWGDPEVVEWIDPSHAGSGAYFKDVANALVAHGYVRNVSIRGAPYDFRKAPNENKQWFVDLKVLVEQTYETNGKVPITFIVHSMGAPMTLVFLQKQNRTWKNRYIARIISLAGAWAGSVKAVKVFAIVEQITSPSLAWLLPSPHFWKPDEVLVQTKSRVYTIAQLEDFFIDLAYPNGYEMRKDTMKYTDFTAPGVEVHCLFGSGIPTVEKLNYTKSGDLSSKPTLINGDGDGTVNLRSLQACARWIGAKEQLSKNISTLSLPGVDHLGILGEQSVVQYILGVLTT